MLTLRKPTAEVIRGFLDSQRGLDFSYSAVGATAMSPPCGFAVDHTRRFLGRGEHVFSDARTALEHWKQFDLGWVQAAEPRPAIREGELVAILARIAGVWLLNACRIVYVIDEVTPAPRFGFAYGTLPGHVEAGEERFLIETDPNDGSVWYDILAFSRPNHLLARFGRPIARGLQKRFAQGSAAAMEKASSGVRNGA